MSSGRSKEEAIALTTTLQMAESSEARCAACDAVLALTKSDAACAVLCSAGGIHAVINALKGATDCEPLLKGTVLTLRNLYRFDSKLIRKKIVNEKKGKTVTFDSLAGPNRGPMLPLRMRLKLRSRPSSGGPQCIIDTKAPVERVAARKHLPGAQRACSPYILHLTSVYLHTARTTDHPGHARKCKGCWTQGGASSLL